MSDIEIIYKVGPVLDKYNLSFYQHKLTKPVSSSIMGIEKCKKCKQNVVNGIQCIECNCMFHISCAALQTRVKTVKEESFSCCKKSKPIIDDNLNEVVLNLLKAELNKFREEIEKSLNFTTSKLDEISKKMDAVLKENQEQSY